MQHERCSVPDKVAEFVANIFQRARQFGIGVSPGHRMSLRSDAAMNSRIALTLPGSRPTGAIVAHNRPRT